MANASTLENVSPQLLKVVERAQREPEGRFHSLAHLIDVPALERAYRRMRKDAAVGVDGVTKEQYGQDLERNLRELHERMKAKRYRHPPMSACPHPEGRGKDAADWGLGVRGQDCPGRLARGVGGDLRAGLSGLLVRLPARA
jgi:RNA-directed DNA polymerase